MRYIISLFVLLSAGCLYGQNLKVTVKDGRSQGSPYAYIKINGRPVEATDSSGVAYINIDKIRLGDTISALFLGMVPSSIVYDRAIQTKGTCEFVLREDVIVLNDVSVTGYSRESSKKLFRKVTKLVDPVNYDCVMDADFNYQYFSARDSKEYTVKGTFRAKNRHLASMGENFYAVFYSKRPAEFVTSSDTTGLINRLNYHLGIILSIINRTIYMISTNERKDLIYSYLGEHDGVHIFRISYPKIWYNPLSYQLILYVDANTKQMCHAELTAISWTPFSGNEHIDQISIETDLEEYSNLNPRKDPILTTKNLRYTVNYAIGSIAKVAMSNEIVNYKKYVAPPTSRKNKLIKSVLKQTKNK